MSVEPKRIGRPPAGAQGEEQVRTRLIMVATELFTSQGYSGVSIREVAEACGFTPAALHYHFGSKANLYAECHTVALKAATLRAEAVRDSDAPVLNRLRQIASAHFRDALRLFDLWSQLPGQHEILANHEEDLTTWRRNYLQVVRDVLAEGQEIGIFRRNFSTSSAAHHFIGALNNTPRWFRSGMDPERLLDEFMELFVTGVTTRSGAGVDELVPVRELRQ